MTQAKTPRNRPRGRSAAAKLAAQQRSQRTGRLIWGAIAVAVLVLVGLFIYNTTQSGQYAGTSVVSEGQRHVSAGTPLTFNRLPPSSGSHYDTPQPAGFYTQTVPEGNWLHSMEHGYVVVLYKPTLDQAQVAQLRTIYNNIPKGKYGNVKMLVVPYERMDAPITAVAWTYELALQTPDADQIRGFYSAHADKGPEDVP